MNNLDRFIVQDTFSDGRPCFFHYTSEGPEWDEDRSKAKVYKLRAAAEQVVRRFGRGEVVQVGSRATYEQRFRELEVLLDEYRRECGDDAALDLMVDLMFRVKQP